ncbi:MAG: 2-hydroxyglutaryl-CoA dehydratase [Candidatus Howiella sp.]|jgi:predicted nucleotide-binding protein (sugar kinase/HSP70/actin superfamily)
MAELVYDKNGRLLFTEEMKKEYTILMPQMLPVHFSMMKKCLELEGFKCDMLTSNHRGIVDTGLKYVHNDTCYPALLVIGQLIEAVESGRYDPHKVALIITQTGGGCRASNYIHLLRKALKKAGLEYVPVISLNLSGLDKNPGFKLGLKFLVRMIYAMVYGDMIVQMANQCRPYELEQGATQRTIDKWVNELVDQFKDLKGVTKKSFLKNLDDIADDFDAIPVTGEKKIRVGVVGEIYIKYSPLGNNNLEDFLLSEGCEPVVPGLIDFAIFKTNNRVVDVELYGGNPFKRLVCAILQKFIEKRQRWLISAIKRKPRFRAPEPFAEIYKKIPGYLGYGNKMGEGWLLTGEMLELIDDGITNIVCTQPFGCLPNHIAGKGMIRAIKNRHPEANIVAIDYDPGATRINQENRIKLMLANARMMAEKEQAKRETEPLSSEREKAATGA